MAFNPDEYLERKKAESQQAPVSSSGFDPDAYLKQKKDSLSVLIPEPPKLLDKEQVAAELEESLYGKIGDVSPSLAQEKVASKGLGEALGYAGQQYDKYTGAPLRAAMSNVIGGKNYGYFEGAPTGEQQAFDIGFEEGGIPAKVVGFGLEMVQDPFMIGGLAAKGISKGAGAVKNVFKGLSEERIADQFGQPLLEQASRQGQEQIAEAGASGAARASSSFSGGEQQIVNEGKLFEKVQPKTIEELKEWKPSDAYLEMPMKKRFNEAQANLPDLETKPLGLHQAMLEDPKAMKRIKLEFDNLPEGDAIKLAQYNQQMLMESQDKINKTVEGITGAAPKNYSDVGSDLINHINTAYKNEKEALAPIFETVKTRSMKLGKQNSKDLIIGIGEIQPKIGKAIIQDEAGNFALKPFDRKMGMSKKDYDLVNDTIKNLNDGVTFEELQNIRSSLFDELETLGPKTTQTEILRKTLLEQMKDMSGRYGDDVQKAFQGWAKNEEMRENFEKIIGGKVESLNSMYKANPDKVVDAVFSNPNNIDLVKQYVGPEMFNELVQAKVAREFAPASDSLKGFLPHNIRRVMADPRKQLLFNRILPPETIQRIKDLADVGFVSRRFLDEVNPSGTAASLASMLEPKGFVQKLNQKGPIGMITSEVSNQTLGRLSQKQAQSNLNKIMAGKSIDYTKDVFDYGARAAGAVEGGTKQVYDFIRDKYMPAGTAGKLLKDENQSNDGAMHESEDILNKTKGSKYEQALNNAKASGQNSLAAAIYVLQNRDEEFRNLLNN